MKRFLIICAALFLLAVGTVYITQRTSFAPFSHLDEEPNYFMEVRGKEIYMLSEEGDSLFTMKGVDLGASLPGHFAPEFAISYETYMEWFALMQEMNANTVRIYTISDPEFYRAFYDYNVNNPDPLYLIHGVWVDDEVLRGSGDAFADKFFEVFREDCLKLVDVLHGNRIIGYNSRHGYGTYTYDVSPWVAGYILGVEWEPDIVLYTDDIQEHMAAYTGTYLYTDENASGFEGMLARVGDALLEYEMRKYGDQRLLAFSNWPETDPLYHAQWERFPLYNLAHVDVEHIHCTEDFKPGMFASYHIYPYYPPFQEFEEPYASYVDETGQINGYRAYLTAINEHHTIPVIISEFGLPSSRGIAHISASRDMNQGNLSEKEQAEKIVTLYEDIMAAGCSGVCVFSWHDEWFKRTWNTWPGINAARLAYWSDYQTNEQFFGLVTFDPGDEESIVYVDGDVSEWAEQPWLLQQEGYGLQACYDEKFVYFHISAENISQGDVFYIPVDITPNSGALADQDSGLSFALPTDFLIRIDGTENSVMLVQEYYDLLFATERREIWDEDAFIHPPTKDSQQFNMIYLLLRHRMELVDGINTDPMIFPTGELRHGIANPDHPDFDSLADYYICGNHIEIRLPWTLFNFSDPTTMEIHDDYYVHYGVEELKIDHMDVSLQVVRGTDTTVLPFAEFPLKGWKHHPQWHMRLKEAYYAMQEAFGEVE